MIGEDAKRQLTQKAIIEALTPLFGPRGILAAHVVVFVAVDDSAIAPVSCSFGLSPELMEKTAPIAVEVLSGIVGIVGTDAQVLEVPARN
jgi:hypothetical protein